ncbi:MAG: zinc ABC transporter substrate-binding protein [Sulfitobacter sp.]
MSRQLLTLSLTASLLGGTVFAEVPKVAVDIAPVHSLVARVMEGLGTPELVMQQGASPHEYSLRPSEAQSLQDANLVFWVGEELSPWLAKAIGTLASDAVSTELLEASGTIELESRSSALFEKHVHGDHEGHDDHDDHGDDDHDDHKEHDDHGDDDHDDHKEHDDHGDDDHDDHKEHDDHGDDDHDDHKEHDDHGDDDHDDHAEHDEHGHDKHDPHAWLSPKNAMNWLNVIAGQLSAADPENAGTYYANAAAGRAEIETAMGEAAAILDPVRGGHFIVFHDAYQYFENDFDFPASGAISIGDASDPSPSRIAEIQTRIKEEGIDCVLAEPQFNPGLVATVLNGTEAKTGILDPLGSDLKLGGTFYPELIKTMSSALADCL